MRSLEPNSDRSNRVPQSLAVLRVRNLFLLVQVSAALIASNTLLELLRGAGNPTDLLTDIARAGVSILLIFGAVSAFWPDSFAFAGLALAWFLMSLQVRIGAFVWWPEPIFIDFLPLGFSLERNGVPSFVLYFLSVPLAFCLWSLALATGEAPKPDWHAPPRTVQEE